MTWRVFSLSTWTPLPRSIFNLKKQVYPDVVGRWLELVWTKINKYLQQVEERCELFAAGCMFWQRACSVLIQAKKFLHVIQWMFESDYWFLHFFPLRCNCVKAKGSATDPVLWVWHVFLCLIFFFCSPDRVAEVVQRPLDVTGAISVTHLITTVLFQCLRKGDTDLLWGRELRNSNIIATFSTCFFEKSPEHCQTLRL